MHSIESLKSPFVWGTKFLCFSFCCKFFKQWEMGLLCFLTILTVICFTLVHLVNWIVSVIAFWLNNIWRFHDLVWLETVKHRATLSFDSATTTPEFSLGNYNIILNCIRSVPLMLIPIPIPSPRVRCKHSCIVL